MSRLWKNPTRINPKSLIEGKKQSDIKDKGIQRPARKSVRPACSSNMLAKHSISPKTLQDYTELVKDRAFETILRPHPET